jgi:hypothetical protein
MDPSRLDVLVRVWATTPNARRPLLASLLALAVAWPETAAGRKRKHRRRCKADQTPCGRRCCTAPQVCFQRACCTPQPEPDCHTIDVSDGCGGTFPANCGRAGLCCPNGQGGLVCQITDACK